MNLVCELLLGDPQLLDSGLDLLRSQKPEVLSQGCLMLQFRAGNQKWTGLYPLSKRNLSAPSRGDRTRNPAFYEGVSQYLTDSGVTEI